MLASLRELGSVTVEALAGRFGVTLQTVRRDVTRLSEAGLLERFHGDVRLPRTSESNLQIIFAGVLGSGVRPIRRHCALRGSQRNPTPA